MTITSPIHLTDAQMSAVLAASVPLAPDRRSAFLEACARELARLPEGVGDGSVFRLVSELQKRYFEPPLFQTGDGKSKYSRVTRRRARAVG
jgi:hypothetical protein